MFDKYKESSSLVHGMAERLGRDIPGAVASDPESRTLAYRAAVRQCTACAHHGECQELQNANATLDKAPSYCRNEWI